MKVLHDKGIFSIEGITVINPEVFGFIQRDDKFHTSPFLDMNEFLKDGDSFDLPQNIIAEKIEQWEDREGNITEKCSVEKWTNFLREVYRLKLKEPLVDTGSKEMSKFSNSEIGSIHWARTVLSFNLRVGEYLNDHGNAPSEEILKEWGLGVKQRSEEVLKFIESINTDFKKMFNESKLFK